MQLLKQWKPCVGNLFNADAPSGEKSLRLFMAVGNHIIIFIKEIAPRSAERNEKSLSLFYDAVEC